MSQKCSSPPGSPKDKVTEKLKNVKVSDAKDKVTEKLKTLDVSGVKGKVSGLASKLADTIAKSPAPQQLAAGAISGLATGNVAMRVGKIAAVAAGGGILLFQIAQTQKLTKMDWDELKNKVSSTSKDMNMKYTSQIMQNASKFGKTNKAFAAGFVGGFLIGLAM